MILYLWYITLVQTFECSAIDFQDFKPGLEFPFITELYKFYFRYSAVTLNSFCNQIPEKLTDTSKMYSKDAEMSKLDILMRLRLPKSSYVYRAGPKWYLFSCRSSSQSLFSSVSNLSSILSSDRCLKDASSFSRSWTSTFNACLPIVERPSLMRDSIRITSQFPTSRFAIHSPLAKAKPVTPIY